MGQIAKPTRPPSVPHRLPLLRLRVRGRGAPEKYDYAQINAVLEKLVRKDGSAALKDFNRVKKSLINDLGESEVPSESQLRRHLKDLGAISGRRRLTIVSRTFRPTIMP